MSTLAALDRAIMEAHDRGDGKALAGLYEQAGHLKETADDQDAAAFLFTQAYIFALEAGLPDADRLKDILLSRGRELDDG